MDYQKYIEEYSPLLTTFIIDLVLALVIFLLGKWAAKLVSGLVVKSMQRGKVDQTICNFTGNLIYALLLTIVLIAVLGQLGIQTASFVAIIGAAGLAVGLALQGSLANFASGVLMILFRPLKVGDYVEAGGMSGSVKDISIFSTTLNTPDNKVVIVPNSAIMGGPIVNYSTEDTRRVDLLVGIAYDANIKQAKEILESILANDPRILKDPAPLVAVAALADSSVNLHVRPWVKKEDYWAVYFDVLEAVKLRFDEAGVGIPFPQMDVHLIRDQD